MRSVLQHLRKFFPDDKNSKQLSSEENILSVLDNSSLREFRQHARELLLKDHALIGKILEKSMSRKNKLERKYLGRTLRSLRVNMKCYPENREHYIELYLRNRLE